MTGVVILRPEARASSKSDDLRELRNDPTIIEALRRGFEARRDGKLIPWSTVKAELALG